MQLATQIARRHRHAENALPLEGRVGVGVCASWSDERLPLQANGFDHFLPAFDLVAEIHLRLRRVAQTG